MSTAPYFWTRRIAEHLKELDAIPLFGHAPAFDWSRFSALAAARFGVPHFTLKPISQSWKEASQLKEGLGDEILVLPLAVGPLAGNAYWLMSKKEIAKITSWIMNKQTTARPLTSEILAEGFYRFLTLQVLDAISSVEPFQKLSLVMSEDASLPETDAYCIDVEIDFHQKTCWGRLVIEPTLQKSWAEHFSKLSEDYLPSKMGSKIEICTSVKVGSVVLPHTEWEKLREGDFIVLDSGSYDPRKEKGAAYLMADSLPLFQVKVKQNKLQIVDYAAMVEEDMHKNKEHESDFSGHAEQFSPAEDESVTLKKVPVYLTVEIARLKIPLEKLMQLAPGNLIELPIHPDQAVKLTVNGQIVGRAELVHLGETLGVRILELA